MTEVVRVLWILVGVYLGCGYLFSIAVHVRGLRLMDPGVAGAGIFFRLLITPGLIALWPWVALRWWHVARHWPVPVAVESPATPGRLRAMHSMSWKGLAVLGPVILALALWYRPSERSVAPSDLPSLIGPGNLR